MTLNWFLSRKVREASSMRRHVAKLLNHQRDIIAAQGIEALEAALASMKRVLGGKLDTAAIAAEVQNLETTANKWLKPYPHPAWRENFEVLLVALAVAMGIRTFFLQPFKIPTGSMQPTLYGVTSTNLVNVPGFQVPKGLTRVKEWLAGASYVHVVAKADGELEHVGRPFRIAIFNLWQTLRIGGQSYTIWWPPDYGNYPLEQRAELHYRQSFRKGEEVIKLRVVSGDHLFVDRLTYNFRPPSRGEIIVFETQGIPEANRDAFRIPGDQFYIKRLIGLGGERIEIGPDRRVKVNGKSLTAANPHFEHVYSFEPRQRPLDSQYSGHVNGPQLAPFFYGKPSGVEVPKDEYLVMGDNTMNSLDSRAWGTFPASYVIGKSYFVYWPLSERFGWGYHR